MARVTFTSNLERHIHAPVRSVSAATVREALDAVFTDHPALRDYVLDDQDRVRRHVVIFVDGERIADLDRQSDPLRPDSEVYVAQALSGG